MHVPFATDDEGRLCSPANAEKGRDYFCPACRESVIFRQGEIRTAHFAHKVSDTCNQETIIHKTAKLLIHNAVREWKLRKSNPPILQRTCQICGTYIRQPLPEKVDSAAVEYRLVDGSIADVALLVGEIAEAAVEIRATHAVDEAKADRLPVLFIEVDGFEIIENPAVWKPIIDNFRPLICRKCKSTYLMFQAKMQRVAKANKIKLPAAYYRYGLCKCWKCKREIIVFAWPKDGLHDESAPRVEPIPRTIRYRFSKTAGDKYWVNTCSHCQSIQGDFFLYSEPDGPFFAVYVDENTPIAFQRDLMRIATHAVQLRLL